MDLEEQLKQIEKERARLDEKMKELEGRMKAEAEAEKKLEDLYQNSGYPTPRALILALMKKYGIRLTGAASSGESAGRRKRTKVTAELRDEIKGAVEGGLSKNAAAKKFEISYIVVNKIVGGEYDSL